MNAEEFKLNDYLFTELIFSKINDEPTDDLRNLFYIIIKKVSSEKKYDHIRFDDKLSYEKYAYDFCCKHFDKYNLDKRPEPIIYFKMLIKGSFAAKIMETKHNLEPYTVLCKICHKPFSDNVSLYYHINEEHNR